MKKFKNIFSNVLYLAAEENSVNNSRYDVVKGVCSGCNSEAANCEKNGKIYTCYCSKSEPYRVKRIICIWLSAEQIYMVMCTEQSCRYEDRKYDGILMCKPEHILK